MGFLIGGLVLEEGALPSPAAGLTGPWRSATQCRAG